MAKFAIILCVVLFASVANTFRHSNNNDKMLIDLATNIKSIEVEMTKNRGYDNIEKIKKVASDLLSNYYEILKTTFISDTTPCNMSFNGSFATICDLSCIDALSIYSSAMANMSTCTSTNFPSLDNYKNEINNSAIITIAVLMELKAKILDLNRRLIKPTDYIISFNRELQSYIGNLEQNITEIVKAANLSVNKTVTDCLNEKFKHFRDELTKQIDNVKKCQTNFNKSLNEIISDKVNGARTELTKLKNDTMTEYEAIIEEWAKDYNNAKFVDKVLNIEIKYDANCIQPFADASLILDELPRFFEKCETIVKAYEFSLIARTHTTALENSIRNLNKCPIHKSFASIINDAHSTECIMQAKMDIVSYSKDLGSFIDDLKEDTSECVYKRFTSFNTTLDSVKRILGPFCPYQSNGQSIFIHDFEWD